MNYNHNKANWTPNMSNPSPFVVLHPIDKVDHLGITTYEYPSPMEAMQETNNRFYGNFRTFTGTRKIVNNVTVYEDTGELTVFANFPITKEDRVYNMVNGSVYEIISRPEDINLKGIYNVFMVRCVHG